MKKSIVAIKAMDFDVRKSKPGIKLSRKQPRNPPTKIVVLNKTVKVLSTSAIPVFIVPGCFCIHWHNTNGKNNETPMMYKLRDDLKSTYCNADKPRNE